MYSTDHGSSAKPLSDLTNVKQQQPNATKAPDEQTPTAEYHLAPSPSIKVYVQNPTNTATIRQPAIASMYDDEIRRLYFGRLCYVSIQLPDGKIERVKAPKISVNLLCATSSVIEAAIKNSVPDRSHVGEVILPAGPKESYEALLTWMVQLTANPQMKQFPVYEHTPAFVYWHCVQIARKLGFKTIIEPIAYRLTLFSTYDRARKGKEFLIVPEDVSRSYKELGKDHALTKILVNSVSLAWNDQAIFSKKYAALTELTYELPEFWDDLKPLLQQNVVDGSPAVSHYR